MKKFAIKSIAIAVGAVCSGAAFAGTVSLPASPTLYAAEALTPTTDVTLPTVQYKMGVGRPAGNNFVLVITPNGYPTTSFTGLCPVPVLTGAGTAGITVKRQSASECAWDFVVLTDMAVGDLITFDNETAPLPLATSSLATIGNTVTLTVSLKDPSELSFVDNSGSIQATIAKSVQAVNVFAPEVDTNTVTNVNDPAGPLFGFVEGWNDRYTAWSRLVFDNNSQKAVNPDGASVFDFKATTGTAALTLTGTSMAALATGNGVGLCIDLDWDGTPCEADEKLTVTGTVGTLAIIESSKFPVAGETSNYWVSYDADQTHSLGTGRTFSLSGTVTPQVGAVEQFTKFWDNSASYNTNYWVWSANAIQLMSPYFTTDPATRVFTRFFFQNVGSTPVTYTAECQVEANKSFTNGPAASGTLVVGQTTIDAREICSFSSGIRGAIVFTINAPASAIKGTYNMAIDSLSTTFLPLERPYGSPTDN